MARIEKKFVLSTSQLNSHKFRCLTEGADLTDFIANPIMYWLHQTPEGKTKDEPMPIGFWEDIKIEGDEITAYPNINDSDPFADNIGKMIEHGTLRAASVEADPIELDTNKKNWVEGQKLPTLKKWSIGEASIVDRGSNKGAIAKLKREGKSIQLSDQASADAFFNTQEYTPQHKMKIKLNKKASAALKLAEDTELDATDVVDKLIEVIDEKETEVVKLKKEANTSKITLMVDKAIGDRKILPGERTDFIALAEASFETTQKLLNSKKGSPTIEGVLKTVVEDDSEVAELMKLSFDELHKGNKLARLKEIDGEGYKLKFKSKFGKLPS